MILRETLQAGAAACIPAYPAEGLSETFIDPAVAWLERHLQAYEAQRHA